MKRSIVTGAATFAALALVLTACSSGNGGSSSAGSTGDDAASDADITLTWAGWGLAQSPEFQVLADDFSASHPHITVEMKDYSAQDYVTQITADLAGGVAPDMYSLKGPTDLPPLQEGGQLLDLADITIAPEVQGPGEWAVDGVQYAVPFRSDSWFLYYNADLFKEAGVDIPDGKWTWDDYSAAAEKLTKAFQEQGKTDVKGTYLHNWSILVQSFANVQAQPDGAFLEADWEYMVPFYENAIALQDAGAQVSFGAISANSLTYGGQFGNQKTAMMPMGSWYLGAYLKAVDSGDAEKFEWGIAPVPQLSPDTFDNPVTFGSGTGAGINPKIDPSKVEAAKEFMQYLVSEEAGTALAKIGVTPAFINEKVADEMFSVDGMPGDELSRWTYVTHQTGAEFPLGPETTPLVNILDDAHSAIMSGSVSPTDGIKQAMDRAKAEVLN